MPLEDHLPPDLRGPSTTITPIVAGLSGAGVYRVEAAGRSFVLKVAGDSESTGEWHSTLHLQRRAADAGLAPRIVHVDEPGRAVLSPLVVDRSFIAFYWNPHTHEAALGQLAGTVRRLHALPLPADAPRRDPRVILAQLGVDFPADFALPDFARAAVRSVLDEALPPSERALVFSHNDLNPSNLVYDGESILLLDWATAGPMDAFYDLAVLSLFLRMDEGTSRSLLSAYEGAALAELPDGFLRHRRLAGALVGTVQLHLACRMKHPGGTGAETLESTLPLGEVYQRLRAGTLGLATADGLWAFGLAMVKESLAL